MNRILVAVMAFVVLAVQAAAATLQFDFQRVVTGDTPNGTLPLATALFEDIATDEVRLTFTHNAGSTAGQFITRLYLTVDPAITGISVESVTDTSGAYTGFGYGQNSFNAPLGTNFDARITFQPNPPRFTPGESLELELKGAGLNAMSFNFLTTANEIGSTPAMIHLQGIAGGGSSHLDPVPEPATLALLAPLAMAYFRKKKSA